MAFTLRPYQVEFDKAMRDGHAEHDSIVGELATGLGKTVSFVKLASTWEHGRTMIICPFISLIAQASNKIFHETGMRPAIEQAENRSNETEWARNPYVVASKQTLCSGSGRKRYERFEDIGLVIVDEAHHAGTKPYADMIGWFRDRGAKVLGVTATLKRHDKRAMGQVFDQCVFQYGIEEAIPDGWLVPIRVQCVQLEHLDLSDVETSQGFWGRDFNQKQLNEKLENPEVIYEICEAVANRTRGEKTAIYCSSVDEAQASAELLADNYGIKADWICADKKRCSDGRRMEVMQSFCGNPEGLTHVCNVGILTTGWDYPDLMNIVNARPTKSLPLYTQILGRLTRPCEVDGMPVVDRDCESADDRRDAIARSRKPHGRMIDLVDNSLQHKLITATDILGGKWSLEVLERVKKELAENNTGPVDIDEEALSAKRQLEREHEEQLRRQRAAKKAAAKFREFEVNPFGGRRSGSADRSQKIMASEKQRRYLYVLGFRDVNQYEITKGQAGRIITQRKSGVTMGEVMKTNRLQRKGEARPAAVPLPTGPVGEPNFQELFDTLRRG